MSNTAQVIGGVIRIGDVLLDNDSRMQHRRRMQIIKFDDCGAAILRHVGSHTGMSQTRISLDRIYADGKPRKRGWSVVDG